METINSIISGYKNNLAGTAIGGLAGFYGAKKLGGGLTMNIIGAIIGATIGSMIQSKMKAEPKSYPAGKYYKDIEKNK